MNQKKQDSHNYKKYKHDRCVSLYVSLYTKNRGNGGTFAVALVFKGFQDFTQVERGGNRGNKLAVFS